MTAPEVRLIDMTILTIVIALTLVLGFLSMVGVARDKP